MYIIPNSTVKIYRNVPLDNTYEHTLYFSNITEQKRYFHETQSILVDVFNNLTYQRVNKKVMRLQKSADSIYDCNYLAFKNTAYGSDKWFYAFITRVEYINDATCEIEYEIDVMQTWLFEVTILDCFVEREHSALDVYNTNRENEPQLVDLIYKLTNEKTWTPSDWDYYLLATASSPQDRGTVREYTLNKSKFYGALHYIGSESQGGAVTEPIELYYSEGTEDRISGIIKVPHEFFLLDDENPRVPNLAFDNIQRPSDLNGFVPRNVKCLQYPYVKMVASNLKGTTCEYSFEDFADNEGTFRLFGDCTGINDYIALVPEAHRGYSFDFDSAISTNGVIDISYGGAYGLTKKEKQELWGQVANSISNLVTSSLSTAMVNPMGGLATGLLGAVNVAVKTGVDYELASRTSPSSKNISANNLVLNLGQYLIAVYTECVIPSVAMVYDEFFTKYGYATNKVKRPNRSSRPKWNYVKTRGCILEGKCPSDDTNKIARIYDNGITFWKNASEVGNYTLNNSPT